MCQLIASRVQDFKQLETILTHSLSDLCSPKTLNNIEKSTLRIWKALKEKEHIVIQTDYDCDGQTSSVILYESLTKIFQHPKELITQLIGQRLTDGYGITHTIKSAISNSPATLLITADNGSSDTESIAFLQSRGIDVIVTDHHHVNNYPPCHAFINPTQNPLQADTHLAGCMVAWLTMLHIYEYAKDQHSLFAEIDLFYFLDLLAIGTLADCVSLINSSNNRIVIKNGMQRINSSPKPYMQAFKMLFNIFRDVTVDDIKFYLAPMINSASRVGDVYIGVKFMMSSQLEEATALLMQLKQYNEIRKREQESAYQESDRQIKQIKSLKKSLCVKLKTSHSGINGIIAGKLKAHYQITVAVFSYKDNYLIGSIRSSDDLKSVKYILDQINLKHPNLIVKYGGHHKAAGLSIEKTRFEEFESIFNEMVNADSSIENSVIWHDGEWPTDMLPEDILVTIDSLQPFGSDWEEVYFYTPAKLLEHRLVGMKKNHMQMVLSINSLILPGICFFAEKWQEMIMKTNKMEYMILCKPKFDDYKKKVCLHIEYLEAI